MVNIYKQKLEHIPIIKSIKNTIFGIAPLHKYLATTYAKNKNFNLLDVGCGNHSPTRYKSLYPSMIYTGLDIAKYNIDENDEKIADNLIILNCKPQEFALRLDSALENNTYDFIIMNHLIEHVEDPLGLLENIINKLNKGGILYLAFPSEQSIYFPPAEGTLNFYDDKTHYWIPSIREMLNLLVKKNCQPLCIEKQYKPFIYSLIGLFSMINQSIKNKLFKQPIKVNMFIWRLYGFESIIVVQKVNG